MAEIEDPILESLQNDVALVGEHLKEIATRVVDDKISDYPVFVAAQEMVDIGKPIFDRDTVTLNWFFNASILEDFIRKKLVSQNNLNRFKQVFGNPKEKACIFVITEQEGRFVFVPYDIDEIEAEQEGKE